ncbi:MAG: hypothetical protein ACK41C_03150 [Phenylobacterium sp.]
MKYAHLAVSMAALTGAVFIAWTAPDRIAPNDVQPNVLIESVASGVRH